MSGAWTMNPNKLYVLNRKLTFKTEIWKKECGSPVEKNNISDCLNCSFSETSLGINTSLIQLVGLKKTCVCPWKTEICARVLGAQAIWAAARPIPVCPSPQTRADAPHKKSHLQKIAAFSKLSHLCFPQMCHPHTAPCATPTPPTNVPHWWQISRRRKQGTWAFVHGHAISAPPLSETNLSQTCYDHNLPPSPPSDPRHIHYSWIPTSEMWTAKHWSDIWPSTHVFLFECDYRSVEQLNEYTQTECPVNSPASQKPAQGWKDFEFSSFHKFRAVVPTWFQSFFQQILSNCINA